MKRARADAQGSSIVRLNVGGKLYHTTRDTLSGSAFFLKLLEHDLDGDKDQDGDSEDRLTQQQYAISVTIVNHYFLTCFV